VYACVSKYTYKRFYNLKPNMVEYKKEIQAKIQGTDTKFWGRTEEKIRARIL
jgi:hypothetical protein